MLLFIALAAILFNVAKPFEQFWKRVTRETFLHDYFKIRLLVQEKKSFKGFSIFSSGGHLVQRSGTVSAILVEGHLSKSVLNLPVSLCIRQKCFFPKQSQKSSFVLKSRSLGLFRKYKHVLQQISIGLISVLEAFLLEAFLVRGKLHLVAE